MTAPAALALRAALALAAAAAVAPARAAGAGSRVLLEWKYLEWDWPGEAGPPQGYDALKNIPVGVRVHPASGDVFLTVPRFSGGGAVPATVARVLKGRRGPGGQPLLAPFPSWEANDPNADGGMRSSLGMALDPYDRMWVLDNGRVGAESGTPQLLVYGGVSGGSPRLVRRHTFAPSVAPRDTSFLNDLALDVAAGRAYITDSADPVQGQQGGLLVYDVATDRAWRALGALASTVPQPGVHISINRVPLEPAPEAGADGVALSPDGETVYFTPLTSRTVHRVPAAVLLDETLDAAARARHVRAAFERDYTSDGIIMDSTGRLFHGSLDDSALMVWRQGAAAPARVAADAARMQWPDTVAFGPNRTVLFMSNGPSHFALNASVVNYRVWEVDAGAESYMTGMADGVGRALGRVGDDDDDDDDDDKADDNGMLVVLITLGLLLVVSSAAALHFFRRAKQAEKAAAAGAGGRDMSYASLSG